MCYFVNYHAQYLRLNVITVHGYTKGFRGFAIEKCNDSCGYRGKDHMWCNIGNDWDYCTPSYPCDASKKSSHCCNKWSEKIGHNLKALMKIMTVSYTHLTLPTILLV